MLFCCLEFSPLMLDVGIVERAEYFTFEDVVASKMQLKTSSVMLLW